jgi:NAD-dependent SIR2 family protein deacetylase
MVDLLTRCPRIVALTGAGCSTGSGIPDYRDDDGAWKRAAPVQHLDFVRSAPVRRRYWARSLVGWPVVAEARPNAAHRALARLEDAGIVRDVVTQNVDGLHQRAGSRRVVDLHGRIDAVGCLGCETTLSRATLQVELEALNPDWVGVAAGPAPDGDADLERDASDFRVPDCPACGGILKPDVVFFGDSVPRARVADAHARVAAADALLVVGSSLMVFSGLRFVRAAAAAGTPVAIVNRGRTRADDLAALKVEADCGAILSRLAERLTAHPGA